jgi:hypothetical protein
MLHTWSTRQVESVFAWGTNAGERRRSVWRAYDTRGAPAKKESLPREMGHVGGSGHQEDVATRNSTCKGLEARRELCGSARRACRGRASVLARRGASARERARTAALGQRAAPGQQVPLRRVTGCPESRQSLVEPPLPKNRHLFGV